MVFQKGHTIKKKTSPKGIPLSHGLMCNRNRPDGYSSWQMMIQRCTNPNRHDYHRYGGRGITVCERWTVRGGIANFLMDMGPRPARASIERINNDGNYEPGNCKWATEAEQRANKRTQKNGLTVAQVLHIRSCENYPAKLLADAFGVNAASIWRVFNGETYSGVEFKSYHQLPQEA